MDKAPCAPAVPTRDRAIEVLADDGVLRGIYDGFQPLSDHLGPLALGDVHSGTDEFNDIAGCVENRMTYSENVLEGAVRKNGSENHLVIRPFTECSFQVVDEPASILRMNALQKGFKWRYTPFRIEAVQSIGLPRPVGGLSGGDVQRPTARVAQPLRFGQIALAPL